ncbi:DUF3667 domain-containing protein [Microscilla marina]|uniref:DUF3667 domain-containing protein n=1 Tax=Microscilla marina ATCC 23134 TaxID=313606 RepID=A1ZST0_MICM2|nr:DUF3667 domain-containing protein [Microscilla marina]EAY26494.1 conserved hypothetical protein [Microscilla marina ATCC 23134]
MKKRRKTDQCLNCGLVFEVPDEFCPRCGQENHQKVKSVRLFLIDSFNDVLDVDSRFYRSIFPFLFKPGLLTNEYVDGKRKRFVQPIRIYLVFSFIYFFVSSLEVNKLTNQKSFKGKIKNSAISDRARRTKDSIELNKLVYKNYKINPVTIDDSLKKNKLAPVDSQYLATIHQGFRAMYAQKQYRDSLKKIKRDSLIYQKRRKRLAGKLNSYRKKLQKITNEEARIALQDKIARYRRDSARTELIFRLKTRQRFYQDSLQRYTNHLQRARRATVLAGIEARLDSIRNTRQSDRQRFGETDQLFFGIHIRRVGELSSLGLKEKAIMDSLHIRRTTINRLIVHQTIRWSNASGAQLISYAVEKLPIVMFFVLPLFALLLKLLYVRRKRYYVEHIIFTLHIHSFAYFIFTFSILFLELAPQGAVYILPITFLLLFIYTYKSFRNVYQQSRIKTLFKIGLIGIAYLLVLIVAFTLGIIVSLLVF